MLIILVVPLVALVLRVPFGQVLATLATRDARQAIGQDHQVGAYTGQQEHRCDRELNGVADVAKIDIHQMCRFSEHATACSRLEVPRVYQERPVPQVAYPVGPRMFDMRRRGTNTNRRRDLRCRTLQFHPER